MGLGMSGPNSPLWSGGAAKDREYISQWLAPNERKKQHVVVAEKALGKPLPEGAVVHHVNECKIDNRNRNLVICENRAYHNLIHARMRVLRAGGDPDCHKLCGGCNRILDFDCFSKSSAKGDGLHPECRQCASRRFKRYKRKDR